MLEVGVIQNFTPLIVSADMWLKDEYELEQPVTRLHVHIQDLLDQVDHEANKNVLLECH